MSYDGPTINLNAEAEVHFECFGCNRTFHEEKLDDDQRCAECELKVGA